MAKVAERITEKETIERGLDQMLTNNILMKTIKELETNKDALTDLLLKTYQDLREKGVCFEHFYYAKNVFLSSEEFDMFAVGGLAELFELFGYECDIVTLKEFDEDSSQLAEGIFTVSKGLFKFNMHWQDSMHDSLISLFVDAKTAKII